MADWGTVELLVEVPIEVPVYVVGPPLGYGAISLIVETPSEVTSYVLAGTQPPVIIVENPVPTTGQIWPRGNP